MHVGRGGEDMLGPYARCPVARPAERAGMLGLSGSEVLLRKSIGG